MKYRLKKGLRLLTLSLCYLKMIKERIGSQMLMQTIQFSHIFMEIQFIY